MPTFVNIGNMVIQQLKIPVQSGFYAFFNRHANARIKCQRFALSGAGV
jgi:hypothetical protein